MEKVKVAFIGAGSHANGVHYPSVAEMEDVELKAICDLDEERLHRTADKYGVRRRYTNYHEMLEKEEIDAVYVIMPAMPLKPIVLDCLAAKKHVFIEKPPGVNTDETREMAEAARKAGVKTMVGFNRRFAHVFRYAKEVVLKEGPPSMALAEFHKNMLRTGPYWNMSILRTDIIHVVDALRDLCGEVAEVVSHTDWHYNQWENSFNLYNALIRFKNGASGILTANRTSGARYERFEFHGRGISTYIRAPEHVEIDREGDGKTIVTGKELAGTDVTRITYGYAPENRHFIDCIKRDNQPLTNFDDAVKTMELVDLIEQGGGKVK